MTVTVFTAEIAHDEVFGRDRPRLGRLANRRMRVQKA